MSTIQESKESAQKLQANPYLLTYRFSTEPEPLQNSTIQTPTNGRINLSVSAGASVFCNKILIGVPIGTAATDFSEQTPSDSVNTAKWSVSSIETKTGKELGLTDPEKAEVSYATFTFETRTPADNQIDYNLVFGLSAAVNQAIGEFDYIIWETSGTANDPASFTLKKGETDDFQLEKVLPKFYLKNLVATTTAAPTVPSTEFANAAGIRLSWESNGTFFQLFEKNKPAPIYAGSRTSFTITAGAATDTTFILVASVTGNPDGDSGAGYEPIYLYDSITITISNPDLTPKSSAVSGNETIGGTLGVAGDTILGNATVKGALGVTGNSTLSNTSLSGNLAVNGSANLVNATVSGSSNLNAATIAGNLIANGHVQMLNAPIAINPGSYIANTDGVVVGLANNPSDYNQVSVAWLYGYTSGQIARATGGNTCFMFRSNHWWWGSNPSSFSMPVKKGASWTVSVQYFNLNEVNPPVSFFWSPIGSNASNSFEKTEDDQEALSQLQEAGGFQYENSPTSETVDNLAEVLSEIVGKKITESQKAKLGEVIRNI